MRQLLPELIDSVDPLDLYADLPTASGRPAVRCNMIASVDGATTVGGVSGGLGGPADKRVFDAVRTLTDVVLVAAGTLRAEHYGPSKVPIAVVTRTCMLDWDAPFFTKAMARPIVVTVDQATADSRARAARVADVVIAGDDTVDLRRTLDALGARGAANVLAEGGPTLNGQLAAADLVDELCLTVAPMLVSGRSKRIFRGDDLPTPVAMELRSLCEEDGFLFLRFRPSD